MTLASPLGFSGGFPASAPTPGGGYGFVSGRWYPMPAANTAGLVAATRNRIYFIPFTVTKSHRFTEIGIATRAASGTPVFRFGIYSDNGTARPDKLLHDFGTLAIVGGAGVKSLAITVTLAPGRYWIALQMNAATAAFSHISRWGEVSAFNAIMGGKTPPTTTSTNGGTGWWSTASTFTGALPATAPALTVLRTGAPAVLMKAA